MGLHGLLLDRFYSLCTYFPFTEETTVSYGRVVHQGRMWLLWSIHRYGKSTYRSGYVSRESSYWHMTHSYECHVLLELRCDNSHYGATPLPNSAPYSCWIGTVRLNHAVGPGLPRESSYYDSILNCLREKRDKTPFGRNRYTRFTERNQASNLQMKVNIYDKIEQVWTCPKHERLISDARNITEQGRSKWPTPPSSYCHVNAKYSKFPCRSKIVGVRKVLFSFS
jgi:hypothetical protein